jgi:DNA polymerase III subunit epsilon
LRRPENRAGCWQDVSVPHLEREQARALKEGLKVPDFAMFLERPLAFFDIEATGNEPAKDRIVSLSVTKLIPDGNQEKREWLCNPCVLMSAEVISIHGITNERVKDCPTFKEVSREVFEVIRGCDLATFNGSNFDIPILWEEFHRVGIKWHLCGINHVDVGNLFKKKEPRTLTAAVKFYCGRSHEGAHNADADVQATIDVLNEMVTRQEFYRQVEEIHPGLVRLHFNDYSDVASMSIKELAEFSKMEERVDLAGKIVRNADGQPVYNFGNSKGVRVVDDPSFGRWMLQKDFSENTKDTVRDILYPQRELV